MATLVQNKVAPGATWDGVSDLPVDEATFQELVQGAKKGCPVSKALAGVPEITLVATLKK